MALDYSTVEQDDYPVLIRITIFTDSVSLRMPDERQDAGLAGLAAALGSTADLQRYMPFGQSEPQLHQANSSSSASPNSSMAKIHQVQPLKTLA